QLPHVVRELHGVDHRVVQVLEVLSHLVAALLMRLVARLPWHEPGRDRLGKRRHLPWLRVPIAEGTLAPGLRLARPLLRRQLQAGGQELQVPEDLDRAQAGHVFPPASKAITAPRSDPGAAARWSRRAPARRASPARG